LSPSDAGINLFNDPLFPTINISSADTTLGNGLTIGPNGNFANAGIFQNQIGAGSSIGWIRGRHSFSFGGNFDRTQLNVINKNAEVAQINFSNFYDFVIGAVQPGLNNSVLFNGTSNRYYRSNQIGVYAQDNIRLSSRLSVNLGFRYDYDGPLVEKYGRLVNFDPQLYDYNSSTDTVVNTGLVMAGNNPQLQRRASAIRR
jgi:outer membrane receptor for ferrienterochelin and colicin